MKKTSTTLILSLLLLCSFLQHKVIAQLAVRQDAKLLKAQQMQEHNSREQQLSELTDVIYHVEYNTTKSSEPVSIQTTSNCNCWLTRDGSWTIVPMTGTIYPATGFPCSGCPGVSPNYRNDDSYTSPAVTLPFSFCLKNISRTSVYINNNGNISFTTAYPEYTSLPFPNSVFPEMIAPFFGDVDTRNLTSGLVYYQLTSTHLAIQWENVGYYNQHADKKNTFQLIITNGSDPIIEVGNNVSFCYKDMQWTTGDASSGVNGFYGYPATVGVNYGDGVNFLQIGLFDRPGSTYLGTQAGDNTAPFSGIDWLDYKHFEFNWCNSSDTVNVPPITAGLTFCDTINLCVGDTANPSATFLSPESGQITSITYSTALSNITTTSYSPANTPTIVTRVIATTADIGYHTIVFTATDNGNPSASTSVTVVVHVYAQPAAATSTTNVSCGGGSNGSAIITASSGTSPYTYAWSPSVGTNATASNLSAGTYSVTVTDANGCKAITAVTITAPVSPTVSSSLIASNCPLTNQTISTTYTSSAYSDVTVCASNPSGYLTNNQTCTDPGNADCSGHFQKDSLVSPYALMGPALTAASIQSVYVSLDTIAGNNSRGCGYDNRLWLRSPAGTLYLLAAQKASNNASTNKYKPTFTVAGSLGVLPNAAGSYNSSGYQPDQGPLSSASWVGEAPGAVWAGNSNENYSHATGQWMVYTNDQVGGPGCNPNGNYTKITEFCITFRTYPNPTYAWTVSPSSTSGCSSNISPMNTANPTIYVPASSNYNCTYNLTMTDASGCTATTSVNINCATLPTELLNYTGKNIVLGNKLEWTTASEINNDYFILKRSTDGHNFFDFRAVKSLSESGNSNTALHYSLIDEDVKPGYYYYKLSQTDKDGHNADLGTVAIVVKSDKQILNVVPNPSSGKVIVNYECSSEERAFIKIYDNKGTLILTKDISCVKGQNSVELDLSGRGEGIYLITITTAENVYKTQLVISSE